MAPTYVRRTRGHTIVLKGSDEGMRAMLRDPMFDKGLRPRAEAGKQATQAKAPRTGRNQTARRGGTPYYSSFRVSVGTGMTTEGSVRRYARLENTNHFALYIEYGNSHLRPAYRTVRSAMGITRFDAPGDIYG